MDTIKIGKIFLLVLVIISSCTINKELQTERQSWNYKHWRQEFKDYTFCSCLIKGYNDYNITQRLYDLDKSYANVIGIAVFDSTVKQILIPVYPQMQKDSSQTIGHVSESTAGKTVFKTCLVFYKSKKLDSISYAESRRWESIKSINSLISKKIPMF